MIETKPGDENVYFFYNSFAGSFKPEIKPKGKMFVNAWRLNIPFEKKNSSFERSSVNDSVQSDNEKIFGLWIFFYIKRKIRERERFFSLRLNAKKVGPEYIGFYVWMAPL